VTAETVAAAAADRSARTGTQATSRTPLRVSLFGGGTDYPEWFSQHPGAVLGFTIDRYIYISLVQLASAVDYRYRVTYSKLERVQSIDEIQHPVVRAVLQRDAVRDPLDCTIQAELPANTGLGSSSAFTVGFLHALAALRGVRRSRDELARLAIETEHDLLGERVGIQDQLHAAYGGLNRFDFHGEGFAIRPIALSGADLARLGDWLVLVYTGVERRASTVIEEQLENTRAGRVDAMLKRTVELVDAAEAVLRTRTDDAVPQELARLLIEGWRLKRSLASAVTNAAVDDLYERCLAAGAVGGKLCGAGGGGFLLLVVPPDRRSHFTESIGSDRCVSFRIDTTGSVATRHW
jgi:D-glycero-alpha-D-manno-heptose-7-phosphate kinase